MKTNCFLVSRRLAAAVVALMFGASAAQAAVTVVNAPNAFGDFAGITYGNGGEVFELQPYVFINGLGGGDAAKTVVQRNSNLDFTFSHRNLGPGLLEVEYRIANNSLVESFDQIRFMVFANPDGDTALFADRIGESWGGPVAGEAARRETMALPTLDNIISGFRLNNNLTDGSPPAGCSGGGGCDAIVAMQWNLASLKPQEAFVLRIGLSDDGKALSSRYLTATALNSPATELTFSGAYTVAVVPEPGTTALWGAGLLATAGVVRRRAQRTRMPGFAPANGSST